MRRSPRWWARCRGPAERSGPASSPSSGSPPGRRTSPRRWSSRPSRPTTRRGHPVDRTPGLGEPAALVRGVDIGAEEGEGLSVLAEARRRRMLEGDRNGRGPRMDRHRAGGAGAGGGAPAGGRRRALPPAVLFVVALERPALANGVHGGGGPSSLLLATGAVLWSAASGGSSSVMPASWGGWAWRPAWGSASWRSCSPAGRGPRTPPWPSSSPRPARGAGRGPSPFGSGSWATCWPRRRPIPREATSTSTWTGSSSRCPTRTPPRSRWARGPAPGGVRGQPAPLVRAEGRDLHRRGGHEADPPRRSLDWVRMARRSRCSCSSSWHRGARGRDRRGARGEAGRAAGARGRVAPGAGLRGPPERRGGHPQQGERARGQGLPHGRGRVRRARRRRPHRAPAAGPGAGRAGRVPGIRHPTRPGTYSFVVTGRAEEEDRRDLHLRSTDVRRRRPRFGRAVPRGRSVPGRAGGAAGADRRAHRRAAIGPDRAGRGGRRPVVAGRAGAVRRRGGSGGGAGRPPSRR